MVRTPVLGVAALTATPSVYASARGYQDLSVAVTLAVIVGAASLSLAVDDPAETSLDACPTTRATRRWMRAALISIGMAGAWALVAASAHHADYALGPWPLLLVEAAAAASISLAFASAATRQGSTTPGVVAAAATLVVLPVVSGLALRVSWLPQLGNPQHTSRWWTVTAIAATMAYWWSRDPASRRTPARVLGAARAPQWRRAPRSEL